MKCWYETLWPLSTKFLPSRSISSGLMYCKTLSNSYAWSVRLEKLNSTSLGKPTYLNDFVKGLSIQAHSHCSLTYSTLWKMLKNSHLNKSKSTLGIKSSTMPHWLTSRTIRSYYNTWRITLDFWILAAWNCLINQVKTKKAKTSSMLQLIVKVQEHRTKVVKKMKSKIRPPQLTLNEAT